MNALRKKLHSSRGASMLMALLLLLVAMMVSITLFTAAMTGYKTIRNDHESEQAVLTLSSAAELFRDAIARTECKTTFTTYYNSWDANYTYPIDTQTKTETTGDPANILKDMLKSFAGNSATYNANYEITADGYETIKVAFSATRGNYAQDSRVHTYTITAVFTGTFAGEERRMVLTMVGTPKAQTPTSGQLGNGQYVKTETFILEWGDAQMSRKELSK